MRAGLVPLKELKALTHLTLVGTKVSDVGRAHLKELKELKLLTWHRRRWAKGLEEFSAAVPKCKITYDGGTIEPKKQ